MKNKEINALHNVDEVITLNMKDTNLLKKELKNMFIRTISPYFDNYNSVKRENIGPNIIYFGAMSRPENYNSAIWFIKHVLNKLPDIFKFIIIGNSPDESLLKFRNERVVVTGYIDNIVPYLETALCFAAPIIMGAGIKIKILEAMSAGLPVLTNDFGIEGIPAKNEKDYIHCSTPEDYINAVIMLSTDLEKNRQIGLKSKQFIIQNFNYENCSYVNT